MVDLQFRSGSLASFTISIYTIGYCFGPLLVAPISEGYGRLWIVHGSYILYLVSLIACGFAKNISLFIVFRAIMGFAGVGFVLLGPATVADLIPREKRGLALSMMSTGPVVVSGFTRQCSLGISFFVRLLYRVQPSVSVPNQF